MKTPLQLISLVTLLFVAGTGLATASIVARPAPSGGFHGGGGSIHMSSPHGFYGHSGSGLHYGPAYPHYGHYYGHYYGHRPYPYWGPAFGFGFGTSYYWDYPYYYGYPYYPYSYGYSYAQPTFPLDSTATVNAAAGVYYEMGQEWGRDMSRNAVPWENFMIMLKKVILPASQTDQQAFRRGFTETYGTNADATFEKAWNEMQGVTNPPAPAPQTAPPESAPAIPNTPSVPNAPVAPPAPVVPGTNPTSEPALPPAVETP